MLIDALREFLEWLPRCVQDYGIGDCATIAEAWFHLLTQWLR